MEKTYIKPDVQILTITPQNIITASSDEIVEEVPDTVTVKLPFINFR